MFAGPEATLVQLRRIHISLGGSLYPGITAFVPDDEAARHVFQQIGASNVPPE